MTGRHNVLNFSIGRDFVEEDHAPIHVPKQEKNMQSILIAREAVIEYESRDVIKKCLSRNLRAHVGYIFRKDEPVQVWQKTQWMGGYRFLAQIHHNGIAECGLILQKVPLSNIRPTPSTFINLDSEGSQTHQDLSSPMDLVPLSPSTEVDSIASECHEVGTGEIIFDAEAAFRFPDACLLLKSPSITYFGSDYRFQQSILYTTITGNTDNAFVDDAQEAFGPSRAPPKNLFGDRRGNRWHSERVKGFNYGS